MSIKSIIAIIGLVFAMCGLGIIVELNNLVDKPPINISESLKVKDDEIATQSANLANLQDTLNSYRDDYWEMDDKVRYLESVLSKSQTVEWHRFYREELCPGRHIQDYCRDIYAN